MRAAQAKVRAAGKECGWFGGCANRTQVVVVAPETPEKLDRLFLPVRPGQAERFGCRSDVSGLSCPAICTGSALEGTP